MKLALILAASLAMVACSETPVITAPYAVKSTTKNVAEVTSGEYVLEVEFTAEYFNDGNGVGHNWRDVEIKQIDDVKVFDDGVEVENYVLNGEEVFLIVDAIESDIRENMK